MSTEFQIGNHFAKSSAAEQKASQLKRLEKVEKGELTDAKKQEYARASRGFESLFIHLMLKEMKRSMLEEKKDSETFGANTMMGYADMAMADQISSTGSGIGIAKKIYRYYTGEKLPEITTTVTAPSIRNFVPQKNTINDYQKVIQSISPSSLADTKNIKNNFLGRVQDRINPYENTINKAAEVFGVDKNLIKAVITAESAGKSDAVSHAGAKGLMQLMDGTAGDMGVSDPYDPHQNIFGGAKYLGKMLDQFGSLEHALAAYNAGPGNVMKYGGIPPFDETRTYVKRVSRFFNEFSQNY